MKIYFEVKTTKQKQTQLFLQTFHKPTNGISHKMKSNIHPPIVYLNNIIKIKLFTPNIKGAFIISFVMHLEHLKNGTTYPTQML